MEYRTSSWKQNPMVLITVALGSAVVSVFWWWWTTNPLQAHAVAGNVPVTRGEAVFRKAGCWYCHHPLLAEMRWGTLSLPFAHENGWVAYFHDPKTLRGQSSKSAHRGLLRKRPDGRIELNQDGKALIAYLRTASESAFAPDKKTQRLIPLSSRAQAEPGFQLYQKLCTSCHGSRGFGDGRLAAILPETPRDLTQPQTWLCRSNQSANVEDIRRTVTQQTGGCGLLAVNTILSSSQQEALIDAVRQIAGMNRVVLSHPGLSHQPPETPKGSLLRKREFRDWVQAFWEKEYDAWLERWRSTHGRQAHIPFRHWRDWKDAAEWRGLSRWIRQQYHTIHLSESDWQTAMQQNQRVRDIFQEWLVRGRKQAWIAFLQQRLQQKLKQELRLRYQAALRSSKRRWPWYQFWSAYSYRRNWMNYEMRSEWPRYLRRYDFVDYQDWREQKERDLFRDWSEKQQGELYWAWKGEVVYKRMDCGRCHGTQGRGGLIPLLRFDPITRNPTTQAQRRVRDLTQESLRCGSSWQDVYRSIVVGVGEHMVGLSTHDVQKYLRVTHIPSNLWHTSTRNPQSQRLQEDLWALAAYIRFLNKQIPILRGIH